MKAIRPIAVYLPQFHPIPENDRWWEPGFTEWTKAKRAKPLIDDHYQPHLPLDDRFYDLGDASVQQWQADLAKSHGIHGFCYYHYWFNGKRLLNLPLDNMLHSGRPDFPFCLAWANEDWTRAWDGATGEVLIKQEYSGLDDLEHIRFLCPVFRDPRYIRVNGKPMFIIYKPVLFPDIVQTLKIWREEAVRQGFDGLYLCYFENEIQQTDPVKLGFDASIEFQPNWWNLPAPIAYKRLGPMQGEITDLEGTEFRHKFFDYIENANLNIALGRKLIYKRYRCVTPMWDNSPRRKTDSTVLVNATPENYGYWLEKILADFTPFSDEENFIFLNAWNEWGEGNHLEPCQKWGYSFLEITKRILDRYL